METHILQELGALFGLSILVVLICHRFKIPSIVGFLITGTICGPSALGLVTSMEAVDIMAEVGVVLLLFTIGMELSPKELARLKKPLLIGGGGQVFLTVTVVTLITFSFVGVSHAIVLGCLMALSSTAIVLSLLQQKAQMESPQGRICLAILIFQDLVIVPMVLLFPLLSGTLEINYTHAIALVAKSVAVLGGIFLIGKLVLPRLMLSVVRTRSRELMLMTTLGICLAVALATSYIGLSLSLGAFFAGLLLAESEYSVNVMENVMPFKDVFTSIFFVSVGMLLNMQFFLANAGFICLLALGIVAVKILLILPVVRVLGYSLRTAFLAAFSLAQVGEFSFVLAKSALSLGLLGTSGYQVFLAASILTMSLTPVLMAVAPSVSALFAKKDKTGGVLSLEHEENTGEDCTENLCLSDHLIIIGFGIGGKSLAHVAKESGIPYIISEMNPDTVARYRDTEPIIHGDASYPMVLEKLGAARARTLAILVSDPTGTRAIIANARKLAPTLYIVVRTRFFGEMGPLLKLGANDVISEEFETSIEVFAKVLHHYLIPEQIIHQHIQKIRAENYGMVRQLDMNKHNLEDLGNSLPDIQVVAYKVEPGADIVGQNLAECGLRKNYGVTVAGIRRGTETLINLDPSAMLHEGDIAYILGAKAGLLAAHLAFKAENKA